MTLQRALAVKQTTHHWEMCVRRLFNSSDSFHSFLCLLWSIPFVVCLATRSIEETHLRTDEMRLDHPCQEHKSSLSSFDPAHVTNTLSSFIDLRRILKLVSDLMVQPWRGSEAVVSYLESISNSPSPSANRILLSLLALVWAMIKSKKAKLDSVLVIVHTKSVE